MGAPCLVFSRLVEAEGGGAGLTQMALATTLALAAFAGLGTLALRALRLPAHTYLPPLVFGNHGNMGLPLSLFAFGEPGLALGIAFFAANAAFQFTAGVALFSGRVQPWVLLRTPVVIAVAVAAAVLLRGWDVPGWVLRSTRLLGDFAVPMMLLALGVALRELRVASFLRGLVFGVGKVGVGLAIGLGIAALLGLDGVVRGVFVLQCTMPSAVFNHLFAQRYGRSPDEVASIVVLSTLVSFVALPWILRLVLEIAR